MHGRSRADENEVMEALELVLARWELNDLVPEDVPEVAANAIAQGCEASELAVLALLHRPTQADVEDELGGLLDRLAVRRPSSREAARLVVGSYAQQMVDGSIAPYAGSLKLWRLANDLHKDKVVFEQLAIFVGLASEWEDHPTDRLEHEAGMIARADALLQGGGLRIA
jgi:hypothetical protein